MGNTPLKVSWFQASSYYGCDILQSVSISLTPKSMKILITVSIAQIHLTMWANCLRYREQSQFPY